MTTLTLVLPDSLKVFIDTQLHKNGFEDVSMYVCSLLHDAQAKDQEARLETLLLEGLASDQRLLNPEFLNGIEAKTMRILDRYQDCRPS